MHAYDVAVQLVGMTLKPWASGEISAVYVHHAASQAVVHAQRLPEENSTIMYSTAASHASHLNLVA